MPDDRPGVVRQASTTPEEVRKATAALTSDVDYAVLNTIESSGKTRYTWLRQELQIPDQEIVEALGRLYGAELIDRTTAGTGPGRESAYVTTPVGKRVLKRLQDDTEPDPDPEPEPEPETEQKTERRRMGESRSGKRRKHPGRPLQHQPKPRKKNPGGIQHMTEEHQRPMRKHPPGAPDFFTHSIGSSGEEKEEEYEDDDGDEEEENENTATDSSTLRVREPIK